MWQCGNVPINAHLCTHLSGQEPRVQAKLQIGFVNAILRLYNIILMQVFSSSYIRLDLNHTNMLTNSFPKFTLTVFMNSF